MHSVELFGFACVLIVRTQNNILMPCHVLCCRPNLDGSIPSTTFHKGAFLHQIIVPAAKLDPRLIHPLLLHILLDLTDNSIPVGTIGSTLALGHIVSDTLAALDADSNASVPETFKLLFTETFVIELRNTLASFNSSPAQEATLAPDLAVRLVLRLFWSAHNIPVHASVETCRKTAVFHFKAPSVFRSGLAASSARPSRPSAGEARLCPLF